jgi:hypothetical protein
VLDTSAILRNTLFVYMHGLGGTGGGASDLCRTAAAQRFHAIGITYPNDWAPFEFCSQSGSDCYEELRREIIDGLDHSPHVAVSPANCVENRIVNLLQHLDALHPGEGWTQFIDNGQPRWSDIVLFGHSQGGANVAVIARHNVVSRVIMSAAPGDFVGAAPAAWWNTHLTPTDHYFGFCHTQDQLSAKQATWTALGMNAFGTTVDIAAQLPPFNGTHELSTSIAPAVPNQYHNSTTTDPFIPRLPDGTPVYVPVWEYMMSSGLENAIPGDINCDGKANAEDIAPFVSALIDPATFDGCDINRADANADGSTDGADIATFVSQLL